MTEKGGRGEFKGSGERVFARCPQPISKTPGGNRAGARIFFPRGHQDGACHSSLESRETPDVQRANEEDFTHLDLLIGAARG